MLFAGVQDAPTANLATVFVYVHFWVGMVVASVLFGNFFRSFNPWLAAARGVGWLYARARGGRSWAAPLAYPEWLGCWPAVAGLIGFGWLELCYQDKTHPNIVAGLAVAYAVVQLAGMAAFGADRWSRRGDGFGVYFELLSRLSVWERQDGVLYVRRPLSGAPQMPLMPGAVALLCAAIGTTSFDGFSNGSLWADVSPHLTDFFSNLGAGPQTATQWASTVGLAVAILVVTGFYRLGVRGMQTVGEGHTASELRIPGPSQPPAHHSRPSNSTRSLTPPVSTGPPRNGNQRLPSNPTMLFAWIPSSWKLPPHTSVSPHATTLVTYG